MAIAPDQAHRSSALLDHLARLMRMRSEAELEPLGLRPRHLVALTVLRSAWRLACKQGQARANRGASYLGLAGVRDDPDVGLGRLPGAEQLFRLVLFDRAGDDHVVAAFPLRRGRHFVVGG